MRKILLEHYKKYPKMQIQDYFKLIHQSEFGPGHLIKNKEENFSRLCDEVSQLKNQFEESKIDYIGNGFVRLNLSVINRTPLTLHTVGRMFELSALNDVGSSAGFFDRSRDLIELIGDKKIPLNLQDVESFIKNIEENPKRPWSHSEIYRASYQPAYRVVAEKFAVFLDLFLAIDDLMEKKENVLIAIDGDCASGKSTLASLLQSVYGCNVLPMDDFFLQPHQRTPERLAMPGGNVDYERVEDVLKNIRDERTDYIEYSPFNCQTMQLESPKLMSKNTLTIVEGSYSLHPELREFYDLKVVLTISQDLQFDRILNRNGEFLFNKFKDVWIPMEKNYAKWADIMTLSDLTFADISCL